MHRDERPLPHDATAAGTARRHAREVLAGWGIEEEELFDALLVVSELVTNAVEHALPPIALHLRITAAADGSTMLHADVIDGGAAAQEGAWTRNCAADEHGRGQQIVAALAESTTEQHCNRGVNHGATLRSALGTGRRTACEPGTRHGA
ncbi:ATP-binding protein [Streptomyces sp. NPDC090073]|uniref:ATP-binding protein n=1 Tax=Streptomyces sp. NPDC090073 TaxID=3365936 RepID=UPI00382DE6A7